MSYEKDGPGTGVEDPQYAHPPTRIAGAEADLTGGLNAFFSMYNEKAEKEDQKMVGSWKSNADGVLHATSLLSIVVTILLSKSYSDLQPSSQRASPLPLTSSGSSTLSPDSPPAFTVWVNALWSMSLVINLTCVLFASLLQQWAYQYLHITQGVRNPQKRLRIRELMAQGVEKYHLPWVASALHPLFNISIFLFLAGLVIFLSNISHTVFVVIFTCVATCAALYLCFILSPILRYDSPYYTPLSSLVRSWAAGVFWLTFKLIYRATGWVNSSTIAPGFASWTWPGFSTGARSWV
ncbi:hypothetical protein BJV78DRAFT_1373057 [Lactifluus subvellereus]|nr:hypothetical protein BJV78DRAFT_1373057 [Lactifluus subvellereus]